MSSPAGQPGIYFGDMRFDLEVESLELGRKRLMQEVTVKSARGADMHKFMPIYASRYDILEVDELRLRDWHRLPRCNTSHNSRKQYL